ncbi:MAG: DHH family phosphoesterase [Eubacterium sp.]|nr:DHH family phosphoesterase [Eubacterium sp.]
MTFLSRYKDYKRIVIQCHDNPDADALASGYALFKYYTGSGADVKLVYSGQNRITKPNLKMMCEKLEIPVKYVSGAPECDLLITVDCRYGESNVTHLEAPKVAVIDHHESDRDTDDDCYIRSNLASCSTIVWDMLVNEGYDMLADNKLSTALYYGLYTDSNAFEELFHPMDRDMRDMLKKDEELIFRLVNTNLSIEELGVASRALNGQVFSDIYRYSVIEAEACDPNILGIISDFVIQVDEVDMCVAYNRNQGGFKLSVRACVPVVKANELARFVCEGIGGGGGHINKAGGFISADSFKNHVKDYDNLTDYLRNRLYVYNTMFDVIYAKDYDIDTSDMKKYVKQPVSVGYVKATDVVKTGTPILIRTLEGDVDQIVKDDLYLMIGIDGEVYPIREEKFRSSYHITEEKPEIEAEYKPVIRDNIYGEFYQLKDLMKGCVTTGEINIFAKKLEKPVKVFTAWDPDKYYLGNVGDYLAVREDDMHDIYVIKGDIFDRTYRAV